jgi:transposase-like protein
MIKPCYRRHRFPIDVIQQAVWLYFRFPLRFRNVEDLLAQRGIDVSYETVRRWSAKFGLGVVTLSETSLILTIGQQAKSLKYHD